MLNNDIESVVKNPLSKKKKKESVVNNSLPD